MDTEQCIRAGGDLKLTGYEVDAPLDITNPASRYFARQALKHILYTTVNSNAMNGWSASDTLKTVLPGGRLRSTH